MESFPWCPGNMYGGYESPNYNAVSYTWGRWKIEEAHDMPEVKAIDIKGVDWGIPRIRPHRFTVQQFQKMIDDTVTPHPADPKGQAVEFLWLDVACINQNGGPESNKEIGRQARIFRGATTTYVWLQHELDFVRKWCGEMDKQCGMMCTKDFHEIEDPEKWVQSTLQLAKEFTEDRWFTSLWTLQEAFLSPNAQLIFEDADKNSFDLSTIKNIAEIFLHLLYTINHDDRIRKLEVKHGLKLHLDKTGFLDGVQGNPVSLLQASHNRETQYEEDRIYGIMQVFDLQLGKSAPDCQEGYEYSLLELTNQFGAAMLEKNSILSQLHVHTLPVPNNEAWRFSNSSAVPADAKLFYRNMEHLGEVQYLTRLSTYTPKDRPMLGKFFGPSMLFRGFVSELYKAGPGAWELASPRVMLDAGLQDNDDPRPKHTSHRSATEGRTWLIRNRPDAIVVLLALHRDKPKTHSHGDQWEWAIGLVVSPNNERGNDVAEDQGGCWKREGVFVWRVRSFRIQATISQTPTEDLIKGYDLELPPVTKELPFLSGNDAMWDSRRGLFG